jgi:hypothetical protein
MRVLRERIGRYQSLLRAILFLFSDIGGDGGSVRSGQENSRRIYKLEEGG